MDNNRKYNSEEEALRIVLEESSKSMEEMDMDLITECLYYIYPPNEEEDRAFIDRTLPILLKKLGFKTPEQEAKKRRLIKRLIVIGAFAIAIIISLLILHWA